MSFQLTFLAGIPRGLAKGVRWQRLLVAERLLPYCLVGVVLSSTGQVFGAHHLQERRGKQHNVVLHASVVLHS